jgi:hypothetical protein
MISYAPIPKVLLQGTFFDREDKMRAFNVIADDGRGDADVSSINRDVARMQHELDRLRPLLAR